MRMILLLAIALAMLPRPAVADSDGRYCHGAGYIAWETRFSDDAPGHMLHIVRFAATGGFSRAAAIPLEDFQVHAMTCGGSAVELHGFDTRWRVDLSDPDRPAITSRPAPPDPDAPAIAGNLGHWARPGVHVLGNDVHLVITRVSRPVPGGIEHYTVTELVRREPAGLRIVAALPLFRGVFLETVD